MLFRKQRKEEIIVSLQEETESKSTPTPENLRPKPQLVKVSDEPLDDYIKLADELGFNPGQLLEEKLLRFLHAHNIPKYSYKEVDQYLIRLAKAKDKYWIWRPLRQKDSDNSKYQIIGHGDSGLDGSFKKEWAYRPYEKAVPIHILRQVKLINDEFGGKVGFFVSDYADPNPDPFIMVTAIDVTLIIFGVWDEPAFFEKPKE